MHALRYHESIRRGSPEFPLDYHYIDEHHSRYQMPYHWHGLEFAADGSCRFIPANGKANQQNNSRFNVRAYPVREENGILFLWYGDADKATDTLPFFHGELDGFTYSEIEDHWNAHYSRAIENQLDVVHDGGKPGIHAGLDILEGFTVIQMQADGGGGFFYRVAGDFRNHERVGKPEVVGRNLNISGQVRRGQTLYDAIGHFQVGRVKGRQHVMMFPCEIHQVKSVNQFHKHSSVCY